MAAIFIDLTLSLGPAAILAAYQAEDIDAIVESLNDSSIYIEESSDILSIEYVSHPLNKIWQQRKMKPPPSDASHWKSILDDIRGEHDTCKYQPSFRCLCVLDICRPRS
jgi:hypothetical protein